MKIVGKFKVNDVLYGIGIKDNKYYVGRIKDNKLYTYLSEDEKRLVDYILGAITPSDNMIKVAPVVVNDNKYDVFYSLVKNLFMFSPLPIVNDLRYLNSIFNNQEGSVYNKEIGSSIKNYFKRLIKVGKKTVVLLLSSAFMLSSAQVVKADVDLNDVDDSKLINIVDTNRAFDISSDLLDNDAVYSVDSDYQHIEIQSLEKAINDALAKNTSLSEEEKDFIRQNTDILLDNQNFVDLDLVLERLSSMQIVYIPESKISDVRKLEVAGEYNYIDNQIYIYKCSSFVDTDINVIGHELFHSFQYLDNYNPFFIEGLNSIMEDEYFGKCGAYEDQQSLCKFLGLVVGTDVLKTLNFTYSDGYLMSVLNEIIPDYDFNCQFIALSRQLMNVSARSEDYISIKEKIRDMLQVYYEVKYKKKVEDDLVALMYLRPQKFGKFAKAIFDISDEYEGGILWKTEPPIIKVNPNDTKEYTVVMSFNNKKLDENDKNYRIGFDFVINEDNRYLDSGISR